MSTSSAPNPTDGTSLSTVLDLVSTARREVLTTATGGSPWFGGTVTEAARRGAFPPHVRVRLLCTTPAEHARGGITEAVRQGLRVKVTDRAIEESLLIDRRLALVPSGGDGAGSLLMVTTPTLITALADAFDPRWEEATPWEMTSARPDEFEQAILRCLVDGLTDDAVANRLGVSARTVRRYVNVLMARVGARSRFELGFRAAECGWLPADTLG